MHTDQFIQVLQWSGTNNRSGNAWGIIQFATPITFKSISPSFAKHHAREICAMLTAFFLASSSTLQINVSNILGAYYSEDSPSYDSVVWFMLSVGLDRPVGGLLFQYDFYIQNNQPVGVTAFRLFS
jgi:hypothetical protein